MQPWLTEMIARGWIVVATDFVGVGTGLQEWLNGRAEHAALWAGSMAAALVGSPIVLAWINARFRQSPARGNCGQAPPAGLVRG